MIVVMNIEATEEQIKAVEDKLMTMGFRSHIIHGVKKRVIGAIGDKQSINTEQIERMPGVESIMQIMRPYKLVSREVNPDDTVVQVGTAQIGGGDLCIIAGPCAVESRDQLLQTAMAVKRAGASMIRGGAFKPRTSPYSFQGLEKAGLEILKEAKVLTGLPVVTEVMNPQDVALVCEYVDVLQIGARNMQNFSLLREVGRANKPVILKRGLAATIDEWLMAAEYVMCEGNYKVILCERGIRTYETYTRNTVDISAIPVIKQLSHLPILVDPSHGTGRWSLVKPVAKAAIAAGADGVMVEVHINPQEALSDGPQSLTPTTFAELAWEVREIFDLVGRQNKKKVMNGIRSCFVEK
jgi:3-deoxy-7-phosphoheptulonate synthase